MRTSPDVVNWLRGAMNDHENTRRACKSSWELDEKKTRSGCYRPRPARMNHV